MSHYKHMKHVFNVRFLKQEYSFFNEGKIDTQIPSKLPKICHFELSCQFHL